MATMRVFISYRRDSDALRSIVLHRLIDTTFNRRGRVPAVEVFRDTRTRLGVDWPDEIRDRLVNADMVLVVIGPGWLGAKDRFERRRIDQPDDWVRREIELALASGRTIVPVAFETDLPSAEALPDAIRGLAAKQGTRVRDQFLDDDLQPVFLAIEQCVVACPVRGQVEAASPGLPYPSPPMPVPPAPMTDDDLDRALADVLGGWQVRSSPLPEDPRRTRVELYKEYRFASFLDVLEFMRLVGDFAEKVNHHPRWENIFRTLRVYVTTFDIGHRVSHLDLVLAQYFDKAYADYGRDRVVAARADA